MSKDSMPFTLVVRKWLVFQLKLAADAFRDLMLSPISTIVLLVDLVQRNSEKNSHFLKLMRYGRRTDHFINLFDHARQRGVTIDKVVNDAERNIKQHYQDRP